VVGRERERESERDTTTKKRGNSIYCRRYPKSFLYPFVQENDH